MMFAAKIAGNMEGNGYWAGECGLPASTQTIDWTQSIISVIQMFRGGWWAPTPEPLRGLVHGSGKGIVSEVMDLHPICTSRSRISESLTRPKLIHEKLSWSDTHKDVDILCAGMPMLTRMMPLPTPVAGVVDEEEE